MGNKKNFFVHPYAVVESKNIGEGTRIWAWTHILPGAKIGKGCNIGEHCYIENKVEIGDFCTIKNGVAIWDGVKIEDHVFIGPQVVFTNDKYPRSRNKDWEMKETLIGRYASCGAGAIILCGIKVGKFSMVGAGAVVTKDVPDFAIVTGNPAKIVGYARMCGVPLISLKRKNKKQQKKMRDIECSRCGRKFILSKEGISPVTKD